MKAIEDYNLALMKDNAAYGRKGDKRGIKSIPGAMKSPLKQRVGSMAVGVEVFVNGLEQIHRSGGGGGGGGLVIPRSDASTNSSDTEKSPASPLTAATTPQRRPPPPPFLSEGAAKVARGGGVHSLKIQSPTAPTPRRSRSIARRSEAEEEREQNGGFMAFLASSTENGKKSPEGSQSSTPKSVLPSTLSPADEHHEKGFALRKRGNFKEAIEQYTDAIKLDKDHFKAYFNRGFARDKLRLFDDAIADYTDALRIDPNNAYAFYNRGISKDRAGLYEDAILDFSKAIEIVPLNADFYHNRGFCHRKQGRLDAAIEDYSSAIVSAPTAQRPLLLQSKEFLSFYLSCCILSSNQARRNSKKTN